MGKKGISAVIPNYNGKDLLRQILPDLFNALHHSGEVYEVIVSDDCSTDDSIEFLEKEYPAILLVRNTVNRGFSPTVNQGLWKAQYDHVLVLNSDVKLSENYFTHLSRYFEKEDTFGVMGRIVGWEDDIIQDGGKYPYFHGTKIKTSGNYIPLHPGHDDLLYSMYLSGANALIDRKKLLELGGFNEIFAPFYVEDYELSVRAWRLGYKCYYEHFAVCRHKVSTTIRSTSRKNFVKAIYYRNKMFLHAIHLSATACFFWRIQNFLEVSFKLITGKPYHLKAFSLFIQEKEKWKKAKHDFEVLQKQKGRDISLKEVADTIIASLKDRKISKF